MLLWLIAVVIAGLSAAFVWPRYGLALFPASRPWEVVFLVASSSMVFLWIGCWLFSRWKTMCEMSGKVLCEDALKHILKARVNGHHPTLQSIAGTLHLHSDRAAGLLADLERRKLISFASGELDLTAAGHEAALHIIRAHRLWESYLADQTGLVEAQWHRRAEVHEHRLTPDQANALSAQLGHPQYDPHGDAIPQPGGTLPADRGVPLNGLAVGETAVITHIEDEPETIYAQITAEGLRPGMKLRLLGKDQQSVRFWAAGDEHVLACILANNIAVAPQKASEIEEEPEFLSDLEVGRQVCVSDFSPACRGAERRRLLDLGLVPGTKVGAELVAPTGDPTAYRVRSALIALRRQQARLIEVVPQKEGST